MFCSGPVKPEFNLKEKKSNTVNMKMLLTDKVGVGNILIFSLSQNTSVF